MVGNVTVAKTLAKESITTSARKLSYRDLFLKPILSQKKTLAAIGVSLIVLSASQALFLLMVKGFLKALFAGGTEPLAVGDLLPDEILRLLPGLAGTTVDRMVLSMLVPSAILAAGLCKVLASYIYQLNQQALALFVAKNFRDRLFQALLDRPYEDIKSKSPGDWMSILMNDVMFLQVRFSDIVTGLVRDGVIVLSCFAVLAMIHLPTCLVLAGMSPLIALGMGRTGRRIARFAEAFQRELAKLAAAVLDIRARFDFVRAQHGEEREKERFDLLNDRYYRMIRKSILVRSAFAPSLEFLGFAVFAGFLYGVGTGHWGQEFTPVLLVQFLVALGLLLKPLRNLGEQLARFHETKGSLRRSMEILVVAGDEFLDTGAKGVAQLSHARLKVIRIEEFRAGFLGQERFRGQAMELAPAKSIAVIGPSGAGKSTMIKTLAGLIRPFEWQADVSWQAVRASATMVSQEPFLFDDTLEANLCYGLAPTDRPSRADIWQALEDAKVAGEVKNLPDGLGTRMRALGANVSGGQLQRLVIARGLLRGRPLWLLDEATSALDVRFEREIIHDLISRCRLAGTCLVAVTHRLQWLGSFDEVWFIEDGRLELAGSHDELLSHPRYGKFCRSGGHG